MPRHNDDGFDPDRARENREEAMARAARNALALLHFKLCVRRVALATRYFTSDDVLAMMLTSGFILPPERRGLGPAFKWAEKLGYCRQTERHILSAWIKANRRPKRVWESLIYGCDESSLPTLPTPPPIPTPSPSAPQIGGGLD